MSPVKLSEWAREQGISYKTAWKWYKTGKLPVPAYQTPTGMILVEAVPPEGAGKTALYARVSSADQRADLDRQVLRLLEYANAQGMAVAEAVSEIGSGLNGRRRKLLRLLSDREVGTIVVEHRDRLMRFGFEYVEASLAAQGRRVVVVEPGEVEDDLVRDVTEVLTSLAARLYGKRAAKHRAEKALEALHDASA